MSWSNRWIGKIFDECFQIVEVKDVPSRDQTMTETKNIRKDVESRAAFYTKQIILFVYYSQ